MSKWAAQKIKLYKNSNIKTINAGGIGAKIRDVILIWCLYFSW